MAKKKSIIPIIVLLLIIVVGIYFVNSKNGFLSVAAEQFTSENKNMCNIVQECNGDCNLICDKYDSCTIVNYNSVNIACINGDEKNTFITLPQSISSGGLQTSNSGGLNG